MGYTIRLGASRAIPSCVVHVPSDVRPKMPLLNGTFLRTYPVMKWRVTVLTKKREQEHSWAPAEDILSSQGNRLQKVALSAALSSAQLTQEPFQEERVEYAICKFK